MTGLNLETFLHLLRADFGAWASLGLVALVFGLMAWTSWGSRRALRKCLVLSILVHVGAALYGGTSPALLRALNRDAKPPEGDRDRLRKIELTSLPDTEPPGDVEADPKPGVGGAKAGNVAPWDRPASGLALADAKLEAPRPDAAAPVPVRPSDRTALASESAAPETETPAPAAPEPTPVEATAAEAPAPPSTLASARDDVEAPAPSPATVVAAEPGPSGLGRGRLRPSRASAGAGPALPRPSLSEGVSALAPTIEALPSPPIATGPVPAAPDAVALAGPAAGGEPGPAEVAPADVPAAESVKVLALPPLPVVTSPEGDVRRRSRPTAVASAASSRTAPIGPLALDRVTPAGAPTLPEIRGGMINGRPLADVPEVYRTRLDPNRSARAIRSGASPESEQAVERALDWLARHQDTDGRWDGATARYDDGNPVKGDDDYTVHCPAGETCSGECGYWEADTALTGLALLAYLGAGYTQADGKYAGTVGKGLDFLLAAQKPDGDLRGRSRAVGMYCHAMATIALCEAYALTGELRLRAPVERAVGWLVDSRAKDGKSWRYAPGEPIGDTSILGWVVMALKSAREVGIAVPADTRAGALRWLSAVATGERKGLARYQPSKEVTPTMTAEAWVCRQFLGAGGPGPASTEAAQSLLEHGPKSEEFNLYYWYYGTLAMYQHGGDAWYRWNAQTRDEIVRRQRNSGHPSGSWDPDDSPYGVKGGRIYCTALATLSLEVYYRYLRLYDEPNIPPAVAPALPRGDRDPALGRLGTSATAGTPSTRAPANPGRRALTPPR